jgi:hypothetical protein
MKRRNPTPAAIRAALAAQSLRLSDRWIVHWLNRPPSIARYQTPVSLARVLSEHHAAVAAEPLESAPCNQ